MNNSSKIGMIILMRIMLPPDTFKLGHRNSHQLPPGVRLIDKLVSRLTVDGNYYPAAEKALSIFNRDGKTETQLLSTIKAKVEDFVAALEEICKEKRDDGLSLELVSRSKGDAYQNVVDSWTNSTSSDYFIWLDTIFGLVLKKDNKPIAVLGLDLDYDHSSRVPGKFTMNIEQIQGVNAYDRNRQMIKSNLKGLNFTSFFMDCCMKLREELHILRLGIAQSTATHYYSRAFKSAGNDKQKQDAIKRKLFVRILAQLPT